MMQVRGTCTPSRLLFDAQIAGDDVEREEQLPLILVHALHLHVEEGLRGKQDALLLLHLLDNREFAALLHRLPFLLESRVIGQRFQVAQ